MSGAFQWCPQDYESEVSWLVVQEFIDFDWDRPVFESAFVEPEFVGLFDDTSLFPKLFPDDAKLYHDMFRTPPESTRKVQWATPLRQYAGCSDDFIRRLLALGPPEDVRIIFWFDY